VGTSSAWTFTVRNRGTGDLSVTGATVEGTSAAEFRVVAGGGGFTVAPGATGTIRVAFQPATVGTKSAALRIASDDADESSVVVPLSGRGVAPDIAAGAGHAWGEVRVGAVVQGVIEVRNEGTSDLAVQASVEGRDSAEFAIGGGTSFVVTAGASRGVEIRCAPASAGPKSATLRLASDDPDEPVVGVALSATAVEPLIAVSPTACDFGQARVGNAASRPLQVRNDGSAPLLVVATDVSGANASSFDVTSGRAPFVVAPGSTHEIQIRFRPGTVGSKSATLRIASDALRDPEVHVPLTGTGTAPDIAGPATHDFGDGRVGGTYTHPIEVRNEGTADLLVSGLEIAGIDAAEFRLPAAGSFVVAPGASGVIQVRWRPVTAGPKSAVLRVASDDPDEPSIEIALAGRATVSDIGVDGPGAPGTTPVASTVQPAGRDGGEAEASRAPEAFTTRVHPNPTAGAVAIEYALPAASEVTIVVYDANGRRVRSVVDAVLPAGRHAARWDGRDDFGRPAASGIYFVRLTAARESAIAKLVLRR
jgi:hypothetical protein